MAKLATPDKSVIALLGDLFFVGFLWVAGSTTIGWLMGSAMGEGGIILLFGSWILGFIGLLIHLVMLIRRWRG